MAAPAAGADVNEGWWLVTNIGAEEPLKIDGTSFASTDAALVVFSRFDWSGAHLLSEVFDPPGRQYASLVGSPVAVMHYALDGDTLYAHAETRPLGIVASRRPSFSV